MNWTNVNWLLGLWLIPVLGGILYYSAKKTQKRTWAFLEKAMADRLSPRPSRERGVIRGFLLLSGLALLIIALAGPQFGVSFEKVTRKGADIAVLLDVSRSMLAEDVAPNRLESAKLDIEDLLSQVVGDRVALIAFAGKPVIKVPLTTDHGFFREVLKKIDVKAAPRGGTAIGDAIRLALRGMEPDATRDQAIILITDGDDQDSMPKEATKEAAGRNVKVFTVALGDFKEGGRIPLFDREGKRTGFEKFNGQEVWTKANAELLTEIAQMTGGDYLAAGTAPIDLGAFYRNSLGNLKRTGYGEEEKRIFREQFQIFLFAGIVSLIGAYLIPPYRRDEEQSSRLWGRTFGMIFFVALWTLPTFVNPVSAQDGVSPLLSDTSLETGIIPGEGTATEEDLQSIQDNLSSIPDEGWSNDKNGPDQIDESLNKTAGQLYNDACREMTREENENAKNLLEKALLRCEEKNRLLRAKIHFNLGVLTTKRLAEERRNEKEGDSKTESTIKGTPNVTLEGGGNAPREDPVTIYRKKAAEREAEWAKRIETANQAESYFREASGEGNHSIARDVDQNLDILRNWRSGQLSATQRREREIRSETFKPIDHLRWLEEELTDVSNNKSLKRGPESLTDYQGLYRLGKKIGGLADDLDSLLGKTVFTEGDPNDPKNVEKIRVNQETLDEAFSAMTQAAKDATAFQAVETAEKIQTAITRIDEVRTSYLDYPTLLQEAVKFQEETIPPAEEWAKLNESEVTKDDLFRRNGFVDRWTKRLMTDAEEEFSRQPLTEEEEKNKPEENSEGKSEGKNDEETTKTDLSSENVPPAPVAPIDPSVKIRKSMKLALELGPEIRKVVSEVVATPEDRLKTEIVSQEKKIEALLRKIAEPLQDKNNQDKNNQDQQKQDQNQSNDQNQDQENQGKNQDQNGSQQDKKEDSQKDQNSMNPNPIDEKETTPQKEQSALDDKEKKDKANAEATMRKVRQRQQQVEELRKAREEIFRRTEKPEKDW